MLGPCAAGSQTRPTKVASLASFGRLSVMIVSPGIVSIATDMRLRPEP
jgi:hypothetical protein